MRARNKPQHDNDYMFKTALMPREVCNTFPFSCSGHWNKIGTALRTINQWNMGGNDAILEKFQKLPNLMLYSILYTIWLTIALHKKDENRQWVPQSDYMASLMDIYKERRESWWMLDLKPYAESHIVKGGHNILFRSSWLLLEMIYVLSLRYCHICAHRRLHQTRRILLIKDYVTEHKYLCDYIQLT